MRRLITEVTHWGNIVCSNVRGTKIKNIQIICCLNKLKKISSELNLKLYDWRSCPLFLLSANRCCRKQRDRVELKHDDPQFDLASTDFDPRRSKTIFIVHGFMSNGEMEWVKNLADAMLDKVSANMYNEASMEQTLSAKVHFYRTALNNTYSTVRFQNTRCDH